MPSVDIGVFQVEIDDIVTADVLAVADELAELLHGMGVQHVTIVEDDSEILRLLAL